MPYVQSNSCRIHYKQYGDVRKMPILLLHAGWGAAINDFDLQIKALSKTYCLIIPDRCGYGDSSPVSTLSPDYHRESVEDMIAVLDALQMPSAHIWGHSDGAVVGAWMAILYPDRVRTLIFEGGHLWARKKGGEGRSFMIRVREKPETLPRAIRSKLAKAHGTEYWQSLLWNWTEAWRLLSQREGDLYQGRLASIACPTLVIHGGKDPHTSLDEIKELVSQIASGRYQLPMTFFELSAGHCLHDDPVFETQVRHMALSMWRDRDSIDD